MDRPRLVPTPGRRIEAIVIAIAATMVVVAACGRAKRPEAGLRAGAFRGANVILVTIDTLRRDRIGAYGSTLGLTPTLDRLAAEGVCYTQAFSHVPMTLPAHASILTGLLPAHHGVRDNGSFRLADSVPTLATELKRAGYRTGAFVGAFVLDRRFGLGRGFDTYDDRLPRAATINFEFSRRPGAEVVDAASKWILDGGRGAGASPFFAWVHLYDPHAPYGAPPEFHPRGRSDYDAAVAYTDAMVGRLLDRLGAAGALDRTVVVVTADHGESLGDHGETTHGLFAYDATIAVPLVVWAGRGAGSPSLAAGRVAAPVGHVDILPTVLDLVGAPLPSALDGQSLVRAPAPDRVIRFEALDANLTRNWAPLTGIVQDRWKYIDLPVPELYDLAHDPGEAANLADRNPRRLDTLARVAEATRPPEPAAGAHPAVDADAAARLRSLGYVGGSPASSRRRYTERDDPKRLVALSERFTTALALFNEGQGGRALQLFLGVLRERPDFVAARTSAATILLASGRAADAVALLRDAPGEQRTSPDLLARLGEALSQAGDAGGAVAALEAARRAGDQNPELLNSLGVAYASAGRPADARKVLEDLLRADPNAAGTWYNLARVEAQDRRPAAAVAALRRAVGIDPAYAEAWKALGGMLLDGDRAAAIDAWTRAEALAPGDYDLLFNLGMVLAESGRGGEALPYLQRFAGEAPRDRYAADLPRVAAAIAAIEKRQP